MKKVAQITVKKMERKHLKEKPYHKNHPHHHLARQHLK
jgi:hypothetical protein